MRINFLTSKLIRNKKFINALTDDDKAMLMRLRSNHYPGIWKARKQLAEVLDDYKKDNPNSIITDDLIIRLIKENNIQI